MTAPWLVLGATGGVGGSLARYLASRGQSLLLSARTSSRLEATAQELSSLHPGSRIRLRPADASKLSEVRALASWVGEQTDSLAGVVHAGGRVGWHPELTDEGFDKTFQVNYLAPFLLDFLLEPLLRKGPSRVLLVAGAGFTLRGFPRPASLLPRQPLKPLDGSVWSAIAKVHHALELGRRLKDSGGLAFAFHPGFLKTGMTREAPWPIRAAGSLGNFFLGDRSRTGEFLLDDPAAAQLSGGLVDGRHRSSFTVDPEKARELWNASLQALALDGS
ncbi:MAG: SDR family NAD(P)-dependent oxidoreductase [Spirochaetales bacterium]|nr:SDR family NAD(P)-dependent oxidoreductase [Spirochaetales bacterium]